MGRRLWSTALALICRVAMAAAPSSNLLEYVTSPVSGSGAGSCGLVLSRDGLAYPDARIDHEPNGFVDCRAELPLSGLPAGYRFSVASVSVGGHLSLEPGSYLEKIEVTVGTASPSSASVKNAYGMSGTGYDGPLDVSIPFASEGGSTCEESNSGTSLSIELFLSLAYEATGFDDSLPHYGSVGGDTPDQQLKITSVDVEWVEC